MSLDTTVISQYYTGILRLTPTTAILNNYATFPTYAAVMESMETSAIASVDPVIRLYQAAFGRVPDSGGLDFWVQQYTGGGAGGTRTLENMASGFVASAEFVNKYGSLSNLQYVGALYTNILNRAGESEGIAYWTNQLNTGAKTRAQVLNDFAQSPEFYDLAFDHVKAFETACALNTETYTGSLFDQGVDPTQYLTVNRDNIIVDGAVANTVFGVIGGTDTTDTNVGTYTLGDNIQGNTLTTVDLVVAGANTPYVTMSGVDALSFNSQASSSFVLDGANFGQDVSTVTARGTAASVIGVTGLETSGTFSVTTSANFGGALLVGEQDAVDPNAPWASIPAGQISTTLFGRSAAEGADANIWLSEGSNSVVLTDVVGGADTVTVVAGDGVGMNDEADVAIFHVVHGSEDLVVAPELVVGTVTDTIHKNAESHVYIDNRATKDTGTPGAARSDTVNVAAVNATIHDNGIFSIDVGSVAQSFASFGTTIPGTATTRDINIGAVAVTGVEQAESTISVYNIAKPEVGSAGTVGNITIASITETATRGANDATVDVVNSVVEATGATGTATVGNLTIGATTITGWNDVDVALKNTVESLPLATATADSTIGNLTAGAVTLSGVGATLDIDTGNNGTSDGTVTVGNLNVGNVSLTGSSTTGLVNTSAYIASAHIQQDATSDDESASVGAFTVGNITGTAVSGVANATLGNRATVNTASAASNVATVGAFNAGNVSMTTGNAISSTNAAAFGAWNAAANVAIDALATVNAVSALGATAVDTATVGAVTAGNLTAVSGNAFDATHGALARVNVNATASVGAATAGSATVASLTLKNLTATVGNGNVASDVDNAAALVSVTVNAVGTGATTTSVGAVTVGDVTSTAGNQADARATIAIGNASLDSLGAVTIGKFTLTSGTSPEVETIGDIQQTVSVDAVAINTVAIGTSTLTGGTGSDIESNINVRASNGNVGSVTLGSMSAVSGTNGIAEVDVNVTAVEGNIGTVTLGDFTETIGIANAVTPTLTTTQSASLDINVSNSGSLTDFVAHNIGTVTVGNINLNLPSLARQGTGSPLLPIYQGLYFDMDVVAADLGSITSVNVGNVAIAGGWGVQNLVGSNGINIDSADNIGNVTIASSSIELGNESSLMNSANSMGDISITADNLITSVNIGNITRKVGDNQYTNPAPQNDSDIFISGARVGNVAIGNVLASSGTDAAQNIDITIEATGTLTTGLLGAATVGNLTATSGSRDGYATGGTGSSISVTYDNSFSQQIANGLTVGTIAVNTATGETGTNYTAVDVISHAYDFATNGNALTAGNVAINYAGTGDAGVSLSVDADHSLNGSDVTIGNVAVSGVTTATTFGANTGLVLNVTDAVANVTPGVSAVAITVGNVSVAGSSAASTMTNAFNGSVASWFTAIDTTASTSTLTVGNIDYSQYSSAGVNTFTYTAGSGTTPGSNITASTSTGVVINVAGVADASGSTGVAMLGAAAISGATTDTIIYDNAGTNAITLNDANGNSVIYFNSGNAHTTAASLETVTGWVQAGTGKLNDVAVLNVDGAPGSVVAEVVLSDYNQILSAVNTYFNVVGGIATQNTGNVYLATIDASGGTYAFYANDAASATLTGIQFVGVANMTGADFVLV